MDVITLLEVGKENQPGTAIQMKFRQLDLSGGWVE